MDWIYMVQDKEKWWNLVNLQFHRKRLRSWLAEEMFASQFNTPENQNFLTTLLEQ